MPVFNQLLFENSPAGQQNLSPNPLFLAGPILNVEVSVPKSLLDLLEKQGKPLPQPQSGIALIDTGATRKCVHNSVMQNLGVNPIGVATSNTANGIRECNLYPAHFNFPSAKIDLDFTSIIEVDLTGQLINRQQIIALIGRDVLANTVFIYNGVVGMFTLTM